MWHFAFLEVEAHVRFEKTMPVNEHIDGIEKFAFLSGMSDVVFVFSVRVGMGFPGNDMPGGGRGYLPPYPNFSGGGAPCTMTGKGEYPFL